jgi:L,D-transpeptidase ErfK/SrfK
MRQRLMLVLATMVCMCGGPAVAQAQQELATALARLPNVVGQGEVYPRQAKEDVYAIARRAGVSASMVYNANAGDLQTGHELLLLPKARLAPARLESGVVVNLAERNLYWYENGRAVRFFPVAIGKRGWETPTGEFTVINKAKNPTWFPPSWALEEEPVPPGPDNPLGDRWMGLSMKGYGIHATNAPWTVGLYVSHGCMRMYPEHAGDLYEFVAVGTPVSIVYRRVVFGYSPEDGTVYMAYHPDPYPIGDLRAEQVRDRLEEFGLDTVVDMTAVERALLRPRGVPEPLLGSRIQVIVDGTRVKIGATTSW